MTYASPKSPSCEPGVCILPPRMTKKVRLCRRSVHTHKFVNTHHGIANCAIVYFFHFHFHRFCLFLYFYHGKIFTLHTTALFASLLSNVKKVLQYPYLSLSMRLSRDLINLFLSLLRFIFNFSLNLITWVKYSRVY